MIWQQLVNGLAVGAVYALIALGFTMVYGVLRIVNFSHGSTYMIGAFFGVTAGKFLGVNVFISLPIAMIGTAVLGVVIERIAIRPLRGADPYSALLSTLGVGMVLNVVAQMIWGTASQPYPAGIKFPTFIIGDLAINMMQLVILGVALGLVGSLYLFVQRTPMGMAMRASSYNVTLTELMGIDVNTMIRLTFFISAALAAAGGVLVAAYYDAVFPTMGVTAGLKAFTAAVVGGIGNIPGAMLGGLLIGILENLAAGYFGANIQDIVAFIVLILVLLFKPTGLLGRDLVHKM